ncbi:antibiotic biosynthesis monooxygenase [Poseidonocella sp. HB161398]|uniref:antibiotic biosynthesis monooxygenase family protein n=1 Tax=Poseidonocella sp. HB161398 TaxID=2320855 RepID=UPI001F0D6BFA|nr:antibiotic biosynthesis monooxygenase family protein [Poseidonocella sp. HB161398]
MTARLALGAIALSLMPAASRAEVTLINVFEVPPGQREAAIEAWEAARDFLREQPGYISTALQGALDETAAFQLVNIATWESPEAFRAATGAMQAAGIFPPVEGLRYHPGLYRTIRGD